jgi:hypothetical protein
MSRDIDGLLSAHKEIDLRGFVQQPQPEAKATQAGHWGLSTYAGDVGRRGSGGAVLTIAGAELRQFVFHSLQLRC